MRHIKEIMILAVCLMMLGFSASVLFGIWCMYQEGVSEYKGLQELAKEEEENETDDTGAVKKKDKAAVDFEALKEINEDIVAWVRCKELGIDYPVVQGKDNSYYLTHTFSGEEHISGCIFMDCINEPDFTDDNTILYGHNMKDGSMFGSIHQFRMDTATVFLYTPEGTDTYEVIDNLVVDVSDEKYFRTVYSTEDFGALSEDVAVRTGKALEQGEHLLTLSTCNGNASKRHLILCRKAAEAGEDETETRETDPLLQIETQHTETETEEKAKEQAGQEQAAQEREGQE